MKRPSGFTIISSKTLSNVGFLRTVMRTVETPDGEHVERIVIEHPGAVAVVPRSGTDVVLVSQYRAAVSRMVLEIPAGKLDEPGESREDAARRELAEETGYIAGELLHLTDLLTAVGFSDEKISIYLAVDPVPGTARPVGAEEESADIVTMPWAEAVARVREGSIIDAKTVAGILIAEMLDGSA
ncbi:MAG: NUDIX hydrolase [Acidimicrobiia bacterium]|nr:MAG: NUDIX hydrolase [Acidimicrobiia bacterium]